MDIKVNSFRALSYLSLTLPLLILSPEAAFAGSSYQLNIDGMYIQAFAQGYSVHVRQSCRVTSNSAGSYSHNSSPSQPITYDQSEYLLNTSRCRKEGSQTRQVQSVEIKFTKEGSPTQKCSININKDDKASSVHKKYDINLKTCDGKAFTKNFLSAEADENLSSELSISDDVIKKFAPTTYLCENNEVVQGDPRPFKVESFLNYVDYYDAQDAKYVGQVTPEYLEGKKGSLRSKSAESFHGESDVKTAPYYVRVKAYSKKDKPGTSIGFVDLQYWNFYGLNGSQLFRVGGGGISNTNFVWNNFARHEGDWEHVTVRVNDSFDKILGIYFSGHGGGHWVAPSDIRYDNEHPVVYSACHSHASGERPKIFNETPIADKIEIPIVQVEDLNIDIKIPIPGSGNINLGAICGIWLKTIDLGSYSSVRWAPWENENMVVRIDQGLGPKWVEYEGTYGPSEVDNDVNPVDASAVNSTVATCLTGVAQIGKDKFSAYLKADSPKGPKFQKSWSKIE